MSHVHPAGHDDRPQPAEAGPAEAWPRGPFAAGCVDALARRPRFSGELRGWAGLAVGALAIAGLLALLLAAARTPGLQDLLPWPWQDFFYKALITHVDLSIVVWYLAALGALAVLATARTAKGQGPVPLERLGPAGLILSTAGCALLLVPALLNWGEPSLNNYVPVLMHPVFYAGLGVLAAGVALVVLRLFAALVDGGARIGTGVGAVDLGIAAAGGLYLIALLCFALAGAAVTGDVGVAVANERLFWGGGHILQFVNTAVMLIGWQVLAEEATGQPALPPRLFAACLVALVAAALPGPLFTIAFDVMGREHRDAFTQMLWYGLALPPAVVLLGAARALWRARGKGLHRSPSAQGLGLSVLLFAVGGGLGYFLGVGDTRTPSHYHAVIGGVNLAVMGLYASLFLPLLGRPPRREGLVRWQLRLYGWGQLLFSVGMFAAGAAGVPRKTAGLDQGLDTVAKTAFMVVYGAGGLIAVIGGILFVWMASARLLAPAGKEAPAVPYRGETEAAGDGPGRGRGAVIAVWVAVVALVAVMPGWRWLAQGPMPTAQRYAITADAVQAKADAMTAAHTVGATETGEPVVRPPPGDVWLVARRFAFGPSLELEAGRTYRLHVASADVMHGFNFPLADADLLLVPGEAWVMTVTPEAPGRYAMQCSEYCGLDHSRMKGWLTVVAGR